MTVTTKSKTVKLESLVREIAHDYPHGLRHAEFVTKILATGYTHNGKQPLSVALHQTIQRLVTDGVLVRSEDEQQGVREYHLAVA